ncbi:hypothetical protein ROT99_12950 [Citrobacter freundii complex sp. 2023EL-00966]|nr:hypothetical protein [Citrobacter freundii complex sp. 2023EL-00966]
MRCAYQAYTRYNTRQIIAILLHSLHIRATMIASAALAGIIEAIVSKRAIS